jgi:hypothetical protein
MKIGKKVVKWASEARVETEIPDDLIGVLDRVEVEKFVDGNFRFGMREGKTSCYYGAQKRPRASDTISKFRFLRPFLMNWGAYKNYLETSN